ncbi:alpha/beta hydrolase [Mycolicibacterium helvum]|uniref:Thioesterase n=1 Tax=Mycolicibacterium helvum TaxID=1534349 RepID=A0A7I7TEQ0_9MYCO|nr:alpha/beta fold hydrolase [Mycolicibacterium helvum]BBY66845.1 thioesterase [Mycolicibacterium helvum]
MIETPTQQVLIEAAGMGLSGLLAVPDDAPRAVIVALHGGSVTSGIYGDMIPGEPSFLELAAGLGFTALAIDRPGYGSSTGLAPEGTTFDAQVIVLRSALDRVWELYGVGSAGIFLTGNSIGGMIALCLAASDLDAPLLGVATHGTGLGWLSGGFGDVLRTALDNTTTDTIDPRGRNTAVYGPPWSWDPAAAPQLRNASVPAPVGELRDALEWPDRLRRIAPAVQVPVRMAIAEYDDRWSSAPDQLLEIARIFTAAPFVDVHRQRFVGHQLCANYAARGFYESELGFVEECRVHKLNVPTL